MAYAVPSATLPSPASVMEYPVQFSVDYPGRPLNRLSNAFRCYRTLGGVTAGAGRGGLPQRV
jgi:hypothetical protein